MIKVTIKHKGETVQYLSRVYIDDHEAIDRACLKAFGKRGHFFRNYGLPKEHGTFMLMPVEGEPSRVLGEGTLEIEKL